MKLLSKKNIAVCLFVLLVISSIIFLLYYSAYHPKTIIQGENKYLLGTYSIEELGLLRLENIIKTSEGMPNKYTVAYFEAAVNKKGHVESFTLSLDTFNDNNEYIGLAGYTYYNKKLTFTLPQKGSTLLVNKYNENSTIDYLDKQIRKIPLKRQIALSGLNNYKLLYQPYTQIQSGTPIFDGRSNGTFPVLSKDEYNSGAGGTSDGRTSVVFRLYDGTSVAVGQQYLYVFSPINPETAIGNQLSTMECDYYINNGKLKFTRNYGEDWIDTDITEEELNSTMSFYRNNLSLPTSSIFISADTTLPIAYFYGGNPRLKILSENSSNWKDIKFPTAAEFGREITKRAVGFISSHFGYAALGTDWSMGGGENKMCYFSHDAGETWTEKPLPMQGMNNTLIDMAMANEKEGVVALDAGADNYFPLLFVTSYTGDNWTEIHLPFTDIPKELQYLTDIESFVFKNRTYTLVLGQGNSGVYKAVFTSAKLTDAWQFSEIYKSSIHTVG